MKNKIYLHSNLRESILLRVIILLVHSNEQSNFKKYILDAIIVPRLLYRGLCQRNIRKFVKENTLIDVVLFDRGFDSWG